MKKRASNIAITLLSFLLLGNCTQNEPAIIPTVTTSTVTSITQTTAVAFGIVTSDGKSKIISTGIVWGTSSNPDITLSTKTTSVVPDMGSFIGNLTGLTPNTTYFVRAYAVNNIGIAYGNELNFKTEPAIPPTVETSDASGISYTSAIVGGKVTSEGTNAVTEYGIVYGKSENPTTADTKIQGNGTGSFTVTLTNLDVNTKYFARSYAVSSAGTGYGNQITFTMKSYVAPTIETFSASSLTETSAALGGRITSAGTLSVIERGMVYSQTTNPTINDFKITVGSGLGYFSKTVDGLIKNTKYYVRAFATTSAATSYGAEINFTTPVAVHLPDSYLGNWFTLSGSLKYVINNNEEIILGNYQESYRYSPYDVTLADNMYDITAYKMGWAQPEYFTLYQTDDTNMLSINSTVSFNGTLWKIVGRSVVQVTFGTGNASFIKGVNTWYEYDNDGSLTNWTYTQTNIDDWSVYLSRNDGARFQIDVKSKVIRWSPTSNGTMTELYKLTNMYND